MLQAQLKEVGIALELRRLDWAAHLKVVDEGAARRSSARAGSRDYPDPENFLTVLFHSRNVGAAGNTSRYRNPTVDRLLDEADMMAAGPARYERYAQARADHRSTTAAWISLYHYASRALIKPYREGPRALPAVHGARVHVPAA